MISLNLTNYLTCIFTATESELKSFIECLDLIFYSAQWRFSFKFHSWIHYFCTHLLIQWCPWTLLHTDVNFMLLHLKLMQLWDWNEKFESDLSLGRVPPLSCHPQSLRWCCWSEQGWTLVLRSCHSEAVIWCLRPQVWSRTLSSFMVICKLVWLTIK